MSAPYYTGKGDNGTSALFGASARLAKNEPVFELLGTLDELNCWLGLCRANCAASGLAAAEYIQSILAHAQEALFIIQADVAGADIRLQPKQLKELETFISRLTEGLPKPESFYVPGGSILSSYFDLARTVARRCERAYVAAVPLNPTDTPATALAYLNRLSSLLYALVRFANRQSGAVEHAPSYGS